jgi:hypothetical protein
MLAPDAEADQPCRDSPKKRDPLEQAQRPGHLVQHGLADDERRQDAVVDGLLGALDDACGERAAVLHFSEKPIDIFAARKRPSEDIRRRNGVLNGEIDSDSADGRHGVGGVADREQPRPPPAFEPIE